MMTETVMLWLLGGMVSLITLLGIALGRTIWARTEDNRMLIQENAKDILGIRQQCAHCLERLGRTEERAAGVVQRLDAICRSMDDLHKKLDGLRDRVLQGRTGREK